MNFTVTVQIEDREYTYELELQKLLGLLGVERTDDEILNAIRENLKA